MGARIPGGGAALEAAEQEGAALKERAQATWVSAPGVTSGSLSQITRLRPLRLAA